MGLGVRQHRVLRAIKRRGKVDESLAQIVQLQPGEVKEIAEQLTIRGLIREDGQRLVLTEEGLAEL